MGFSSIPSRTTTFLAFVLLIAATFPLVISYTVVLPDSTSSSALIDAPQTNFAMNKNNGAHTDPHEQDAVYAIMKATGNDWATDIPDVCRGRWHGIECMPDNNNVYHVVSLSFGSLSDDTAFPTCDPTRSFISSSITKLPHIRTLFFYRCFTGNPQPIPSFLGQLGPSLQTLILRENGHVGSIPIELANLTNLRVLDLHKNYLNGSIPASLLARVTGLKSLDLSWNRLTGHIPVLNSPSLVILDLSKNMLSGTISHSIGNSKLIIKLDLSRNRLSGPIPTSITTLKELILLDLSFNQLTGPIPSTFNYLTSLQALILKGNTLMSTSIPNDMFDGMSNLVTLVLSRMNLHGFIPESLAQLPRIRVIHLDGNKLNGSIPTSFGRLKHLSELRLEDNHLSGVVPFGKDTVWRMRRKLRLHNNYGLCFVDDGSVAGSGGGYDDLVVDLGVGYCQPKDEEFQVQHLGENDMFGTTSMPVHDDLYNVREPPIDHGHQVVSFADGGRKRNNWRSAMWLSIQIVVLLVSFTL